ncbi:DNA polymerase III subunit beta [Catellatospora bangladeshensis]|uniref:DNA polymerase III subunit beta n=1 Tax=Catellatospora bangladeshensis TaxID=310355 RepID=A0A8J3NKW3_9ACTN|nr:DNA polymerase III subunit beta [Catellatospora bangladeshensis]GIF84880.1 DNA polymerase III subunit beta [Catellatospora bangladeshensis]
MGLDMSVESGGLAEAAAQLLKLLPVRSAQPGQAGVLLSADAGGVELSASDGEVWARVQVPAQVHEDGEVVVSRRALAETLGTLDAPRLRLCAEGARLAVRTDRARFALPQLDLEAYPRPPHPPQAVGVLSGADWRAAAGPVASAASREDALPLFTAVRMRSLGATLSLLATDRFRLAAARPAWREAAAAAAAGPTGEPSASLDVLIPAGLVAELARQAGRAVELTLHAADGRFALSWPGWAVGTASLAVTFPDRQLDQLLRVEPEATVRVDADELAAAVGRAAHYAGPRGAVTLELGDGELCVRGSDPLSGESAETLKADLLGDRLTRQYQARYLLDALRPFTGAPVRLQIQSALRPTLFTAATPDPGADLRYLVVPLRPTTDPDH